MPYIAPEWRRDLDPLIDALAAKITQKAREAGSETAFAGILNYAVTRLALSVVKQRFGTLRYWLIALLSGVFQNVSQEFYRRLAAPYEDRQKAAAGDVDLFAAFLQEMDQT